MAVYNVSKIENWYDDFTSCKNKYSNTYYEDYIDSYIKSCGDSTVRKMNVFLNSHYGRIKRIYDNINKFWVEYLNDLKNIDNRLAGGNGYINVSSISSKISKLPSLKEYKADISVKFSNAGSIVGTPKHLQWIEDNVTIETCAVIATSVYSGMANLTEKFWDGVIWCGGIITSGVTWIFDEETSKRIQEKTMNIIAYDVVSEANKYFYENTSIGKQINEASSIKYDSKTAKTIQTVSEKGAEIAAATAITVATGGLGAPLSAAIVAGTGFMIGAGGKAEEVYQQDDRSFFGDAGEIAIAASVKAVEFYFEGQMGNNVINVGKAILSTVGKIGGKSIISSGAKSMFEGVKTLFKNTFSKTSAKEVLKQGFKTTLKDVDTYIDSLGAAVNNIEYSKETGLNVDWKALGKETACNFALNFGSSFVGEIFGNRMTKTSVSVSDSNIEKLSSMNLKDTLKTQDDFVIKYSSSSLSTKNLSYNFNKLNDTQKIRFIQNSNINKLEYVFSDVKNIEKYKDIIDDKIIRNQNNIFSKDSFEFITNKNYKNMINYISNDSSVLKNISDENLTVLLAKEKWYMNGSNSKKVISEIENRIIEGKFGFYNRDILISTLFGKQSAYSVMINSISNDTSSILLKNMKETVENLSSELKNIDYGDYGLFSKVGLTNMSLTGRLDSNSIKIINEILMNNKKGMSNFNIELLDKDIVRRFNYQTLNQIGNDYNMSKQIIDLYNNNRNLFDSFTDVMKKSSKDNSLNTFYIKSKCYLNYIYENSEILSKIDKAVLTDDSFINYVLYNQNTYSLKNIESKKIRLDYTKNYDKEFAMLCDNMFDKAVSNNNLRQAKEAYFQKYFSVSYDEAKNFISKYGAHFDEVIKYDNDGTVTTIINTFKKIDDTSDINFIKKIYDTQKFNFSAEEMIHIDSKIKEVYSQSYVEKLSSTQRNIQKLLDTPNMHEVVNYNGKTVNIIDYHDNFNFLVHSSDTGFTMDKVLVNGSYIDTWKSISPDTHALSTSYITESNIGSAPVKNQGVLYGFTDINVNDIGIMAPYDVNSHITDYGFGSGNNQIFVSADQMSNNTYRVYNEVVLDRQSVRPSCVIVYKDMSQENMDSAIKAASEWNIPIIRIDKVELANNQLNQIRNSLNDFKMSGNMESLKYALDKYESNVSGYKLNAYVKEGHKDATAAIDNSIVSNLFKSSEIENSLLDIIGNMDNKNQINELINYFENIKRKYNILNDGGTGLVANTKESFDIDTLIKIAKEKIGEM